MPFFDDNKIKKKLMKTQSLKKNWKSNGLPLLNLCAIAQKKQSFVAILASFNINCSWVQYHTERFGKEGFINFSRDSFLGVTQNFVANLLFQDRMFKKRNIFYRPLANENNVIFLHSCLGQRNKVWHNILRRKTLRL